LEVALLVKGHHFFKPHVPCVALVTDLYMDRASFKGQNVKDKVPSLLELLDNCDLEKLLEFFEIAPLQS
jgi:hypothetical protein